MNKYFKIDNDIIEKYTLDEIINCLPESVQKRIDFFINDLKYEIVESMVECESPIEQIMGIHLQQMIIESVSFVGMNINVIGLYPQAMIECGKKKYRVDFLIPVYLPNEGTKNFIIECNGHEFHEKTKEQVARDNKRQRDLTKLGYVVINLSGSEIVQDPFKCCTEIRDIILSYYK